jgi:two-component system sensor histidine kinase/response regulator
MPDSTDSTSTTARGIVLVVDDQLKNVQVVGGLLTNEGYEVIPATSGEQALQRMIARKPDLVLLDVLMPEVDGFEVCNRIRAQFGAEAPPIIFLSAADEKDVVVRALESGGVDYVSKPFNKSELLARVRTHIELKLARDAVARAIREKDELMSMVAHDLKNPIGAVRFGAMAVVESGAVTGRTAQEMMQHIVTTSEDMLAFIERFLSRKAREADLGFVALVPVNLASLMAAIAHWQTTARRKNITLTVMPPAAGVKVTTDPRMLDQILDNLISNALKFTPSGGKVAVQAEIKDGQMILSIEDSGPGFKDDDLPRLFQDYTRLSAQPTAGESSTGLGLAIAKRHAERLGAELTAGKSKLGGACFTLRLPLNPVVS